MPRSSTRCPRRLSSPITARIAFVAALLAAATTLAAASDTTSVVPSPSEFLGFTVGADRTVADYRQIRSYFDTLAESSPRLAVEILGETTLGEELFLAVISSEANIANRARLQEISRRIADPRGLSEEQVEALVAEGRLVLLITCNIHATEVGASQMAMEWAHALATAEDEETLRRLNEVVLLLVPSLNPDGQIMETEWYRKNLDTDYEGGRMPWLYHHYVGHDNNRDWFMLTQKETRAVSRAVYHEWLPQVWLDEHQMGRTGPRMFLPPYTEPVDPDIHPLIWREVNLIGANMALRLEQAGKSGVIYGYAFDAYWPGGTKNTAWWKNVSGLLTEVASVRYATPVRVEEGELSGGRKGLVEYGPQTSFPNPWPGGWWRLRDIMDYERIASDAILETCADRREDFLRNAAVKAQTAVAAFGAGEAYRIPAEQRDPATAARLAALMAEHAVEVLSAADGDVYIPLAQPYGLFVHEMLSTQRYPEIKLVRGEDIVQPYDVSAWTLPLMMGVEVERTEMPDGLTPWQPPAADLPTGGDAFALAPGRPEDARLVNAALRSGGRVRVARRPIPVGGEEWPAGTVFLDGEAARAAAERAVPGQSWTLVEAIPDGAEPLSPPRVGLYKPWQASMDEGWTRFVLETYGFEPKSLENETIKKGGLGESFDVIVLPSVGKETIETGKRRSRPGAMRYVPPLPPEYRGGLNEDGAEALREFVEQGGTLVALASSAEYVLSLFDLPARNALGEDDQGFASPGALLRVQVNPDHPVTWGLPPEMAVFQTDDLAFDTALPGGDVERWVLASYPRNAGDILLSGWMQGAEKIARRAAAVATTRGQGKVVLLGFRPQQRAQTPATYPFLFNALYWSVAPRSQP